MTKDELTGEHHWLNGHEFEQTLGDSGEHGSMVYCSPDHCLSAGERPIETRGPMNSRQNIP